MSSPANANSGRASDAQPRQVMNVAVLAESELGSEAQRERRKRILDATMAIASKNAGITASACCGSITGPATNAYA